MFDRFNFDQVFLVFFTAREDWDSKDILKFQTHVRCYALLRATHEKPYFAFPLAKRTSSNLRRYSQLKFGKKGKIEGRKSKLEVGTFFTEYSTGFLGNLEEQSTRKFSKS